MEQAGRMALSCAKLLPHHVLLCRGATHPAGSLFGDFKTFCQKEGYCRRAHFSKKNLNTCPFCFGFHGFKEGCAHSLALPAIVTIKGIDVPIVFQFSKADNLILYDGNQGLCPCKFLLPGLQIIVFWCPPVNLLGSIISGNDLMRRIEIEGPYCLFFAGLVSPNVDIRCHPVALLQRISW